MSARNTFENINLDMTDQATLALARAAEALASAIGDLAKRDQSMTKYGIYIDGDSTNVDEEMLARVVERVITGKPKGRRK